MGSLHEVIATYAVQAAKDSPLMCARRLAFKDVADFRAVYADAVAFDMPHREFFRLALEAWELDTPALPSKYDERAVRRRVKFTLELHVSNADAVLATLGPQLTRAQRAALDTRRAALEAELVEAQRAEDTACAELLVVLGIEEQP